METHNLFYIFYATISLSIFLKFSVALDTIFPNQSIIDDKNNVTTLVSSGETFELGFFSPGKSKNRYIGVWYKNSPHVVVWVANRNTPLTDSYGELTVNNKTNHLVLLNQLKEIVWSSNSSKRVAKNPVAQLLESGNLVLRESESLSSELYLWQSFDYPTDTHLAGMKLGWDLNTGFERYLTSWKSSDDPSSGEFTYKMSIKGLPQLVISRGSTIKYRTGTWNGVRFSGIIVADNTILRNTLKFDKDEAYYVFGFIDSSVISLSTLNYSGLLERFVVKNKSTEWTLLFTRPYEPCDNYGYCGVNGICKTNSNTVCECLQGYSPISQAQWDDLNLSKGCRRKTPLDCRKGEGFVKLAGVKLPDLVDYSFNNSMSLDECKEACLKNCSCKAYANSDVRDGGSGCLMWFNNLIDVTEFRVEGSDQDIYIRLSASEIKSIHDANMTKRTKVILVVSTISSMCILVLLFWCIIGKLRKRARGKSKDEDIELPLFDLATITSATNNFSSEYEIGAGGFGSVYKVKLPTGQEVAVKRLSKDSGQGLQEFRNEVQLISQLQHRNLVALLGCCVEGEEKILIYEYMPNKSLNNFIFDATLDWEKRFDIIMGIARGLLYLHQDSKLQIIHRDFKASNILLDYNMKPKISDFGLARIFGGGEKETETKKVIGTYGYMSPEYAIEGKFSIKSDVFSFGVVLLEIISGKKNRGFSHSDHHHNLLGHAWLLWNEDKAMDLIVPCLKGSCVESQVLRCIHVGLLCVQKFSGDRPTMASVVVMLTNEGTRLPCPKQPAFFVEGSSLDLDQSSSEQQSRSEIKITISWSEGR
ncbi:hypothetical protein UlMin_003338 [Ulmus minor]